MTVYCTLVVWQFKPFLSVGFGRYIHIFLTVYGPEIIGGFGLEDKNEKRKQFAV